MLYLISIRIVAHRFLIYSSNPAMAVHYDGDLWPMYYSSFNIIMGKQMFPSYSYVKMKDAIDLLIRNGHIKNFPFHDPNEVQQLREDWGELYKRYIVTDEGVFAMRSKYYRDDWVFNVVLAKVNVLQGILGVTVIWMISSVVSLLNGTEAEKKPNKEIIILIEKKDTLSKSEESDTTGTVKYDTLKFLQIDSTKH